MPVTVCSPRHGSRTTRRARRCLRHTGHRARHRSGPERRGGGRGFHEPRRRGGRCGPGSRPGDPERRAGAGAAANVCHRLACNLPRVRRPHGTGCAHRARPGEGRRRSDPATPRRSSSRASWMTRIAFSPVIPTAEVLLLTHLGLPTEVPHDEQRGARRAPAPEPRGSREPDLQLEGPAGAADGANPERLNVPGRPRRRGHAGGRSRRGSGRALRPGSPRCARRGQAPAAPAPARGPRTTVAIPA
jgi:hypothetical protein